jgi:acetyl esterase/lipase
MPVMNRQRFGLLGVLAAVLFLALPDAFSEGGRGQERGIPPSTGSTRYLNPVFEKVEFKKDVPFKSLRGGRGTGENLNLDIYFPAGDPERMRPAVLWLHGGGFKPGNDKTQKYIVTLATEFAKRGYVSIAADYRVRPVPDEDREGTLRDAVEDGRAALSWMRGRGPELGLDPGRIAIAGGSAGGKLAVNLAALENGDAAGSGASGVFALVDLWGSPESTWRTGTIGASFPPTLIIHGTKDLTVPFALSEQLAAELQRKGIECLLIPIPDAVHTPTDHMADIVDETARFLYRGLTKKDP